MVDGDDVRALYAESDDTAAYDLNGRYKNAGRVVNLCRWLDRNDLNVVCATLSIFPDIQKENRNIFSQYFEVFIDVPMEQLEANDTKQLYRRARLGEIDNVVGVDIEFPTPPYSDMTIDNRDFGTPPSQHAEHILSELHIL